MQQTEREQSGRMKQTILRSESLLKLSLHWPHASRSPRGIQLHGSYPPCTMFSKCRLQLSDLHVYHDRAKQNQAVLNRRSGTDTSPWAQLYSVTGCVHARGLQTAQAAPVSRLELRGTGHLGTEGCLQTPPEDRHSIWLSHLRTL